MKESLAKLYEHMRKHYVAYSFASNVIVALAIAGLALLGVLTTVLTVGALVTWGVVLATLYGIGKWLDQEVDDLDKLKTH